MGYRGPAQAPGLSVPLWLLFALVFFSLAPPAHAGVGVDAATANRKLAPEITVIDARRGRNNTLLVEVEVTVPSGEPVELVPRLNGQPLAIVRPPPDGEPPAPDGDRSRDLTLASHYTLIIPRAARGAELTVTARTRSRESTPATVLLGADGLDQRPVLYLLSVGVGHYARAGISELRYPPKDARDLATVLQQQKRELYREVKVQVLTDSAAGRDPILKRLEELKSSVTEKDTLVIFLAGHGTNDADGRYYFLPYDAKADHDSMLSGQTIQDTLRGIAGRVVLMLDTCHSGNVLGKESYTRLINELTQENRIVVFTAATGEQAAHESPAWQNGAFTKALIEGLRGSADYTEDGQLTMSELETWTSVRVKKLTRNVQTPTLAKPNTSPDYVLAALPSKNPLPSVKQVVRRRGIIIGAVVAGVAVGIALGIGSLGIPKDHAPNVFYPMFQ